MVLAWDVPHVNTLTEAGYQSHTNVNTNTCCQGMPLYMCNIPTCDTTCHGGNSVRTFVMTQTMHIDSAVVKLRTTERLKERLGYTVNDFLFMGPEYRKYKLIRFKGSTATHVSSPLQKMVSSD